MARGIVRWLGSTSNRTFVALPIALYGAEAALQQGWPALWPWAIAVMAWGYLQYKWVGLYRSRLGGGGPGISVPPERIVEAGPYRFARNPMYLGHLVFLAGLALLLRSWLGLALWAVHVVWFHRRVVEDERRLEARFGEGYRAYCARVRRWGIL